MTLDINPARIATLASAVDNSVHSTLEGALNTLNGGGTVEGGDFSITGTPAGMAYPYALQWAYADLDIHLGMLTDMAEKLRAGANNYAAAEDSSTVQPG